MLNVPNLLGLSQQIGMLPTQLPRVFSSECSFSFMLSYWWSLHPAVSLSYYVSSPFSLQFSAALFAIPLHQVHVYFRLLFPGSPTSASSYCRSGERGSQSGENALVGVCVSWWKPSSHSPLDQGKSFAPSVKEALWHSVTMTKWAILVEELVSGFCTSSTAPYGAAQLQYSNM